MLSICIIAKNESKYIDRCLSALLPLNAEIIFVDTGSTDNTKEIASKYTNHIYDFEWCNDFSATRNFAISKAANDCILSIDADEVLTSYDETAFKKIISIISTSDELILGRINCRSLYTSNGDEQAQLEMLPRMFSKKVFEYSGIIHEQLTPIFQSNKPDGHTSCKNQQYTYKDTSLSFDHYGYFGDEDFINQKTERNIELLQKMHENNPEDPYVLYQLGKSYYMRHDYVNACDIFGKCLYFDLNPALDYVQDLVTSYGYTLINTNQFETALSLEGVYEEFKTSCEFVFMMALVYMNNGLLDDAIKQFTYATTFSSCKVEGSNSYRAFYNIAVIYECAGQKSLAREYYKKCGRYSPAKLRLRKL